MDEASGYQWQKSALLDPNSTGYAVACARYLQKDETGKVVETPEAMIHRVSRAVAAAEESYGLFQACSIDELAERFDAIMLRGEFMPSSPILMSAGREQGSCSACYVLPVPDDLPGIR